MENEALKTLRIGIVSSRFNNKVVKELCNACMDKLEIEGVLSNNITHETVPGALEIPIMLDSFARKKKFDVLIGVGAVIRGETYHFEIVSDQSANGLLQLQLNYHIPIINAIITTNSSDEAFARTKLKGEEAALGAIEMAELVKKYD
ncbi:6,7-dimethyl-8-ribityllumazine synthase [Methylophilaceae bacterium]|mgnify:FL=1|nr:6,7-dimethyl-8-ribityllumazine synthase [Methylophilaceae bacterium]MDC1173037.1 6,7-dimethyl-8-ribityllumazine synthase [Methylophilaceae bacterium]